MAVYNVNNHKHWTMWIWTHKVVFKWLKKIQVLLCAILKCICVNGKISRELLLVSYFYELLKYNLYLYVHNYYNANNYRWYANSKFLLSWDFFIPNFCYHNLFISILCKQIAFTNTFRAKEKILRNTYCRYISAYISNGKSDIFRYLKPLWCVN